MSAEGPPLGLQVATLARRSVLKTMRQPAQVIPSLIFPIVLLAVNASGLSRATNIPGFPTHSYLTFALAITFMQGAMFAMLNAGTNLANDIETGFLNRLALTPMRRAALLVGQLAGVGVLGFIQSVLYIAVGLTAGAHIKAGVGGALVLIVLGVFIALAFGALGTAAALRTGSGEAVQGLFPLMFVFLFLSSSNLPRDLLGHGWFKAIATANPVSYLLEGLRSLLITGWDGEALALAFGIGLVVLVVGLAAASAAMKQRLVRT
ncbi:MAG: ABC transporter permease [Solirubrobacteraceae bacterium]